MGFQQPSALYAYHKAHGTDSLHDRILEVLAESTGARTTLAVIGDCYRRGISAPSTAHRAIKYLFDLGYIESRDADDARVRLLMISDAGRAYLKAWGNGGEPS